MGVVKANYGRDFKFISVDCTMGLYIPMMLERLGFDMESTQLRAASKVNNQAIGKQAPCGTEDWFFCLINQIRSPYWLCITT